MASPMKSTYRGSENPNEGTVPSRPMTSTAARHEAIVLTRIALREGDHTDILEALGIIPTVHHLPVESTACADCAWVSSKPKNPKIALMAHRRAKHQTVTA